MNDGEWFPVRNQKGKDMNTNTYYVAKFYREGDPRPKFLSGETPDELMQTLKAHSVVPELRDQFIVTVAGTVKKHWLSSTDYCSICNNWDGVKCFCGEPIIHQSPLFINI